MEFKLISIETGVKTTVTANNYIQLVNSVLDKDYQFKVVVPKATQAQQKVIDHMKEGKELRFYSLSCEYKLTGGIKVHATVATKLRELGFLVMTDHGGWSYIETYSINENTITEKEYENKNLAKK